MQMQVPKTLVQLFLWLMILIPTLHAQRPGDAAAPLQDMFDQFAKQGNAFVPGLFGELSDEQRAKLERIEITPNEETEHGKILVNQFSEFAKERGIKIVTTGKNVDYLRDLVAMVHPLMKNADRYPKIDIRVVSTSESDAYSIPGGHLIFTTGLLDSAQSEAALIGVVGHELSHLDRGHQLLTLKQSKALNQATDFRDGMMWGAMMARPFRPEQETEADADAVRWIMQLGYDPKELAKMLVRWQDKQSKKTPWMQFVPGFVRTHPNPGQRAKQVLDIQRRSEQEFPNAKYIGRENLSKREAKINREFDE
jgi:predicted Zn-dependent protease